MEQGEPADEKLITSWTSAAGEQAVVTIRDAGESNAAFIQRHILEYTVEMVQHPPVEQVVPV